MKIFNKEISTNHIIIAVLIGVILLLAKCNSDVNSKYKAEQIINQNNIEVLNDSVKTYRTKNGSLISERGVLIAEKDDLKSLNKDLYDKVNELEKSIPDMEPQVVIEYRTKIVHDTVYLNSDIVAINDSTQKITFNKDTTYVGNNYRNLAGAIWVHLKADSTNIYNKVELGDVLITKDEMNIEATLVLGYKGEGKDKVLKVWLETKYPGFQADEIEAVTLDPMIHPELRKLNNKRHSIGPMIGIGIGQNFQFQPVIGIGYQYSLFKF